MKKNFARLCLGVSGHEKTLLIMRNVLLIILVTAFQSFAVGTYSQTTKLNFELKNTSLKDVLAKIEEQSDYYFLYNSELIDVTKKVDLSIQDQDIKEVLDAIFDDAEVSVTVKERHIILTPVKTVTQQEMSVSGVVTDGSGAPLPGVTVIVKGTTMGTITDFYGNYTLVDVPNDGVLVFSFVGMKSLEVSVNGRSIIDATLEEETIGLEEVVAIGYGTVTKKDLTGAVSSVKTEELKQNPVANVAQALQGKLSGVSVISQDGRPGADVSIRIRGGGSITQSNDPLIVVDGIPGGSLSDIPADQIESIDVLKDASSTAIFGARGANGVILVTTKGLSRGEGKTRVSYSGYYQTKEAAKTNDVLDAQEYLLHNWSYMTAFGGNAPDAMETFYGLGLANGNHYADYANVPVHNYTNDLLRSAMTQEHNISVSSATEKTNIAFNANMIDDEGIKIKSGYKRYNAILKLEHQLYTNVKLGFNVSYVQSRTEGAEGITNGRGTLLSSAYLFRPIDSEYIMGHGDLTQAPGFGNGDVNLDPTYDPYQRTMDIEDVSYSNKFRGITYLDWEIVDGLTFRTELFGNRTNSEQKEYDAGTAFPDDLGIITDKTAEITVKRGYAYRSSTTLNWEVQNLSSDHKLSVLGGWEFSKSQSNSTWIYGRGYPSTFDFETAIAKIQYATIVNSDGEIQKNNFDFYNNVGVASTITSGFGRFNYSYKQRYLFTATFRADASSKFAPNHSWGYFPAGAFAWRVSDESFMTSTDDWLDNLKFRLSIGASGADNIPYYAWNNLYDVEFSSNGELALAPKGVKPNVDLKWETTTSRNLGIDYGLFNNRIYGSVEAYWNTTKDLLGQVPINPVTGFTTQFQNVGKTSNKGIEVSLGADLVRQDDFTLSINATYNYNKNNIEQLADGILTDYGTDWNSSSTYPRQEFKFQEGVPLGTVFGYEYDGFYSTDDFYYDANTGVYTLKEGVPYYESFNETGNYPNPFTVNRVGEDGADVSIEDQIFPGALKIKDTNNDGKITPDDATKLGEVVPRHTGGFGISAYYKGIDLSANFTYALGGHVYNIAGLLNTLGSKDNTFGANRYGFVRDTYKVYDVDASGDLVAVTDPSALEALNANAKYHTPYQEFGLTLSEWFEKSDYLRLNTLTVGYTLPKMMTQNVGIERLRLYVTGGNLFTITGYSGLDPEVNTREKRNSTAYPTPGLDFGAYPRARTFTFGVNVDF